MQNTLTEAERDLITVYATTHNLSAPTFTSKGSPLGDGFSIEQPTTSRGAVCYLTVVAGKEVRHSLMESGVLLIARTPNEYPEWHCDIVQLAPEAVHLWSLKRFPRSDLKLFLGELGESLRCVDD